MPLSTRPRFLRRRAALALVSIVAVAGAAFGQANVTSDINWKIRKEATDNSQIMRTMHFLSDVYGPRLTGSPNFKAAADWSLGQMRSWGLENAHLEPWNFGHPGWANERLSAHIISPVKDQLTCEALAWTPGTSGAVTGAALQIVPPARATKEQLAAYLDGVKSQIKGKVVLVGKHEVLPVSIFPAAKRRDEADARRAYDAENPTPFTPPAPTPTPQSSADGPKILSVREADAQINEFLLANGALVRVNDAGREHGQIRAFANYTFDPTKAVPTVVMRSEDYGRIARILKDNTAVQLEFNIVNRTYPEGSTAYNVIAEIPGTDLKDQVVMLGGHLDSWHAATGATDNAIGCAVMMEAARVLKAIGVRPRRTIRVALWSGEEQGLLGSKAYVKEHFNSFENPTAEFSKFNGYINIDAGTGRARGALVFGPSATAAVIREALKPFEDLGVYGAIATSSRRTGGTDSTSFNQAGLPGINMGQDPIEYGSHTWHTNLDNYERIIEGDAQTSAIVIAATVYQLAMRDEMLPRFTKETMPQPPPQPTPTPAPTNTSPPTTTTPPVQPTASGNR